MLKKAWIIADLNILDTFDNQGLYQSYSKRSNFDRITIAKNIKQDDKNTPKYFSKLLPLFK